MSCAPISTRPRNPATSSIEPPSLPKASKHGHQTAHKRAQAYRLLSCGFTVEDIVKRVKLCERSVYRIHHNVMLYGSIQRPRYRKLGRRCKLTLADKAALYDKLYDHGWMYQDEISYWLECERGVSVSQPTISRTLRKDGISLKSLSLITSKRSEELRDDYRRAISRYMAEELVFIDKSIFNEKTGWRHRAYAPIREAARYVGDAQRGKTWSILPAYTVSHRYLSCTAVREGYFNTELLLEWLETQLLPAIDREIRRGVCIVLDNCSSYCNPKVEEVIREAGHCVQYLPPYSPSYNPIKLTFSVLKSWIRRHFYYRQHKFDNFRDFLGWCIVHSRCNQFASKHFAHAGRGGLYVGEAELQRARDFLRAYERGEVSDSQLLV